VLRAALAVAAATTSGGAVEAFGAVPATAGAAVLYASATATGSSSCTSSDPCTLAIALTDAAAGKTIELTTAGSAGSAGTYYTGAFTYDASGTSASSPVTIEPEPGLASAPILDGGGTQTVLTVDRSTAPLELSGVVIQDGFNSSAAGAISNSGTLTLDGVSLVHNSTTSVAGAIDNTVGASLTVQDSTFEENTATYSSGAILNDGDLVVSGSTFYDNSTTSSTGYGGAIYNTAGNITTISASTFDGNVAGSHGGGAIDNAGGNQMMAMPGGSVTVTSSTFVGDQAPSGTSDEIDSGGALTVTGDIFDGSCVTTGGTVTDDGYNVGLDSSCQNGGTADTTDASLTSTLGSLQGNGGPTETIEPLSGNPAIGLIPSGTASLCPTTDQRGDASTSGAACDAGAVQLPPLLTAQTISFTSAAPTSATAGGSTYTPTATASSGLAVTFSLASSSTGCTIASGVVSFTAAGTCVVDASQAGNGTYAAATSVDQSFAVAATAPPSSPPSSHLPPVTTLPSTPTVPSTPPSPTGPQGPAGGTGTAPSSHRPTSVVHVAPAPLELAGHLGASGSTGGTAATQSFAVPTTCVGTLCRGDEILSTVERVTVGSVTTWKRVVLSRAVFAVRGGKTVLVHLVLSQAGKKMLAFMERYWARHGGRHKIVLTVIEGRKVGNAWMTMT
jgi:hypothetical protein